MTPHDSLARSAGIARHAAALRGRSRVDRRPRAPGGRRRDGFNRRGRGWRHEPVGPLVHTGLGQGYSRHRLHRHEGDERSAKARTGAPTPEPGERRSQHGDGYNTLRLRSVPRPTRCGVGPYPTWGARRRRLITAARSPRSRRADTRSGPRRWSPCGRTGRPSSPARSSRSCRRPSTPPSGSSPAA